MPDGSATDRWRGVECLAGGVRAALADLLNAWECAGDADRDVWEFAVEMHALASQGVSTTDLRWLTCRGLVRHASEITFRSDATRTFRPEGELSFGKRSCFVLSEEGVAYARSALAVAIAGAIPERVSNRGRPLPSDVFCQRLAPRWDTELRELRLNGLVVKRYRVPSPNQEVVLAAFEEEGWPRRVDDPLPPQPGKDSKRRLHDTIKCLNQRQIHRVLRFQGDGLGEGVCWEFDISGNGGSSV